MLNIKIIKALTVSFVITITVATTAAWDILESKKAAEDEHEKAGQLIRTVLSSADITRNNKVFLRCFWGNKYTCYVISLKIVLLYTCYVML
jgi:hypothetical protein